MDLHDLADKPSSHSMFCETADSHSVAQPRWACSNQNLESDLAASKLMGKSERFGRLLLTSRNIGAD